MTTEQWKVLIGLQLINVESVTINTQLKIYNMEYIIIKGVRINIKQYGFSESEILDGRLRNLLEEIITTVRNENKEI